MAGVILGHDTQTTKPVWLGDRQRLFGLSIIGRPQTGKTTLIKRLIRHDIAAGHGLFFLDPNGQATQELSPLVPASQRAVLNPEDATSSFGINLTRCPDVKRVTARTATYNRAKSALQSAFRDVFQTEKDTWGPYLQLLVENTLHVFIENPDYTLAEAPEFLRNDKFRNYLVATVVYNAEARDFWRSLFCRERMGPGQALWEAALRHFATFLELPQVRDIVGQLETTVDLVAYMNAEKVVFLTLSDALAPEVRRFIGTIFTNELLEAARERAPAREGSLDTVFADVFGQATPDRPAAPPCYFSVYIDEFPNFIAEGFATLITNGPDCNIATTISHREHTGQLADNPEARAVALAAANTVVFALTPPDAQALALELAHPAPHATIAPALVFSPDAATDLRERGHPEKKIRLARGRWLWIVDLLREAPAAASFCFDPNRPPPEYMEPNLFVWEAELCLTGQEFRSSAEDVGRGIGLLNTYYANWMRGFYQPEAPPSQEEIDLATQIVACLAGVYGFKPTMRPVLTDQKRSLLQRAYEEHFKREQQEKIIAQVAALTNPWEKEAKLARLQLERPGRLDIPLHFDCPTALLCQQQAALFGLPQLEVDSLFAWQPITENASGQRQWWQVIEMLLRFEYMQHRFRPSQQAAWELPQDFSEWRFAELRLFIQSCLRGIGRTLQAHPIRRPSGTGQTSVTLAPPPQTLVTEMAKQLVSLPVFTASMTLLQAQGGRSETVTQTVNTLAADTVVVELARAPDALCAQTPTSWLADNLTGGSRR